MERFKGYEPEQNILIHFDPDKLFAKQSFERILVTTIKELDLSCFWENEDAGGNSPYDPRGMLGILFYGIAKAMFSTRKIEAACKTDHGFMYVSGHTQPDHTTIARFITRHQEAISYLFTQVLYIIDNRGILDLTKIAIDGSKIKAYASSRFTGTKKDFEKKKFRLTKKINLAIEKLKETNDPDVKEYWEHKKESNEEELEKISNFIAEMKPEYNSDGTEKKQNITDPDSRLMKSGQKYQNCYNAQIAVNETHGFIVGADMVNEENDKQQLKAMIEKTREQAPEGKEEELKDAAVLCDNGYVSNESIQYSVEEELNVFMPTSCDKKLYREELNEEKENVTADDCTYEKNGDEVSCTCPGGKTFTRTVDPKTKADKKIAFTAGVKSNCDGCPYFEKCRGKLSGTDKKFTVTLARIMIDKDLKAHIEKMKTDEAKQIYSKRMDIVEKVFGHIKENWGLDKLYRRGLQKAKTTWILICIAYNLKKLQTVMAA